VGSEVFISFVAVFGNFQFILLGLVSYVVVKMKKRFLKSCQSGKIFSNFVHFLLKTQ